MQAGEFPEGKRDGSCDPVGEWAVSREAALGAIPPHQKRPGGGAGPLLRGAGRRGGCPARITEFALPTASSHPLGITAGPDGALWFTEASANKIGRITTAGAIAEVAIPTASSGPTGITAGPDGALWFTELLGNKIGKLVPDPVWSEAPGVGLTPSSPAAVLDSGGTLHLFVRGVDSRLYVNSRVVGFWTDWSEVPGGGLTPNQPAAVLDSSGALRLFVQGTDNRVYVNTRTGGSWSGWSEVPGGGQTLSGPGAVLDGGLVRLFVRGMDDRIYTNFLAP